MPQCTAKSKRTGERCRAPAMTGTNVCYHHGGKSRRGVAHSGFKHGRYSKHLPANLADRHHEAVNDPALLEMREEIALAHHRIANLLDRLGGDDDDAVWAAILETADHKRRYTEAERKRLVEAGQVITVERAMGLVKAIAESVARHVTDPVVKQKIADDINAITRG